MVSRSHGACSIEELVGLQAIDAARRYLENGEKEDADRWIVELASRVGRPYPPGTEKAAIAADRLVREVLPEHLGSGES
jgi:hypothetical protein